jgi:hypothetical protein
MALSITLVERVNLGSIQGVIFDAAFTSTTTAGETFTPALVGLQSISILTFEPVYVASGTHEYGVSYNKAADKLTTTDGGAEAGSTATVRCLAFGR